MAEDSSKSASSKTTIDVSQETSARGSDSKAISVPGGTFPKLPARSSASSKVSSRRGSTSPSFALHASTSVSKAFNIFSSRNSNDNERRLRAELITDEYTELSSTSTQPIHELHRTLEPVMWGVMLEDLDLFESEVRKTLDLGLIPNYDESHANYNQYHWDASIGPNVHQVNKYYIKPVTWRCGGMSYALMLNESGLKSDVFATHCWNEGIFEFVDKCLTTWPRNAKSVWCCFLANPQNSDISELLSGSVFESPFAQALRQSSYMMVLPNHQCSIYTRLWCVLEAKLAIEHDIDIILRQRMSSRRKCFTFIPTLLIGLLAYAYIWTMCMLLASHVSDLTFFGVLIFLPIIAAGGIKWFSHGRCIRIEIYAQATVVVCLSAVLFFGLYHIDDVLHIMKVGEEDETSDCTFRVNFNTCADTLVLLNIAFIGMAANYKRKRSKRTSTSASDTREDDVDYDDDDDDYNDDNHSRMQFKATLSEMSESDLLWEFGELWIFRGEVLFLTLFIVELSIRIIASHAVCPMISVGTLVMEITFNAVSVIDIALTYKSHNPSSSVCCPKEVACFGGCATIGAVVALLGKFAPKLSKAKKLRRIVRLLKLLRLSRLICLLEFPRAWWLCWCLVATFLHSGMAFAVERILQIELNSSAAQLEFTSVRDASCSHGGDQLRLFEAIRGKEDEIDIAINVFRAAGKYDRDVKEVVALGFEVSMKNTRYDWHGVLNTSVMWGVYCVASDQRRNPTWWLAPCYIILSCSLAACLRPRAHRLNFAVFSWRRPVWGALVLSILIDILGLPYLMLVTVRQSTRVWGICTAAMGPRTATTIHSMLWRNPTKYGRTEFAVFLGIVVSTLFAIIACLVLSEQYGSCWHSSLDWTHVSANYTPYVGDPYWDQYKKCYFQWFKYYHLLLLGFYLMWTCCGVLYERRVRLSRVEPIVDINRALPAAELLPKSSGLGDASPPVQWVELSERS